MILRGRRSLEDQYRALLKKVLGGYSPLRRLWRRYRPIWLWERTPSGRANAAVVKKRGLEVGSGPFKGMRYPPEAVGRTNTLGMKLLGIYEVELSDVFEEILRADFSKVVDIGAGEGFYAVGLALKKPESAVYAFETDAGQRRVCRRIASHNGVLGRIQIAGSCNVARLSELSHEIGDARTLVVCDCEGCELQLLQPAVVPFLKRASLLVELHPSVDPRIPSVIQDRFRASHSLTLIQAASQPVFPELSDIPASDLSLLASERRGGEVPQWAYLSPRVAA